MSTVFGPIPSRRLGRSLGINNIPPKVCSYSCVYCQVGLTSDLSVESKEFYQPVMIYTEVKKRLNELRIKGEKVDYLSFVPDGEPTLDINLAETIRLLQEFGIKIAVFTNSSLIWKKDVRDALCMADFVSIKIDTIDEKSWRKINRPSPTLDLDRILKGILEFRENYRGKFVTETMLIDGLNDNEDNIIRIAHFILKADPAIAYLTVPTRPTPIKNVQRPVIQKTNSIYRIVKSVFARTELLNAYEGNEFTTGEDTEKELMSIMAVHPMRKDALEIYLSKANADWNIIKNLIEEKKIRELDYDGNKFYKKY